MINFLLIMNPSNNTAYHFFFWKMRLFLCASIALIKKKSRILASKSFLQSSKQFFHLLVELTNYDCSLKKKTQPNIWQNDIIFPKIPHKII